MTRVCNPIRRRQRQENPGPHCPVSLALLSWFQARERPCLRKTRWVMLRQDTRGCLLASTFTCKDTRHTKARTRVHLQANEKERGREEKERKRREEEGGNPLKLQTVVSHETWVLGTEPRSSRRAASPHDHGTSFSSPPNILNIKKSQHMVRTI